MKEWMVSILTEGLIRTTITLIEALMYGTCIVAMLHCGNVALLLAREMHPLLKID